MNRLILVAAVSLVWLSCAPAPQAQTSGQPPPIGGGYTNVTAIPVNDPAIKAIGGALFKPIGAGQFPAVVYISGCSGLNAPPEMMLERTVIDHLLAKGVATLIVDPFTSRNEPNGMCASVKNLNEKTDVQINYFIRGGNDALAAVNRKRPDRAMTG
jgi:dienelactone hydrolase